MSPSSQPRADSSGLASKRAVENAIASGWRLAGDALVRDLEFRDFDEAMGFALELGRGAVDWFRRPAMLIRSNLLRLTVANLHHAGVTEAELRLVSKATAVIEDHRARGTGRG
jgi:pterin-4a-carbinolamine dehydratase